MPESYEDICVTIQLGETVCCQDPYNDTSFVFIVFNIKERDYKCDSSRIGGNDVSLYRATEFGKDWRDISWRSQHNTSPTIMFLLRIFSLFALEVLSLLSNRK